MKKPYFFWGAPHSISGSDLLSNFEQSGRNSGNLLIGASLKKILGFPEIIGGKDVASPQEVNDRCSAVVIPASNFLWKGFDFGGFADFLEKTNLPVLMVGVGAQANKSMVTPEISPGTLRLMKVVSERTAIIGVRGFFTAEVLADHGIRNTQVIGCPSFYAFADGVGESIVLPEKVERLAINCSRKVAGHSFDSAVMKRVENRLLKEAFSRESAFFAQDEIEEVNGSSLVDGSELCRYFYEIQSSDLFRFFSSSRIFFDIGEWLGFLAGFQFSIGTRFHGNMMALHAGIPAVILAHDSRTRELCIALNMPYINILDDRLLNADRAMIDLAMEVFDGSSFARTRQVMLNRFSDFMGRNGFPLLPQSAQ